MSTSEPKAGERVRDVRIAEDDISVDLIDGRTVTVPLAWYPRLLHATPEQRAHWKIAGGGFGIHWPDIDEDLSTAGILRGAPAPGVLSAAAAGHGVVHSHTRPTRLTAELQFKRSRNGYLQNPPEPTEVRFTVRLRAGIKYERRVALDSDVTAREAARLLEMSPAELYQVVRRDPKRFRLRKRSGVSVVHLRAVLEYGYESGRVKRPSGIWLTN